jgi:hypothetical protein
VRVRDRSGPSFDDRPDPEKLGRSRSLKSSSSASHDHPQRHRPRWQARWQARRQVRRQVRWQVRWQVWWQVRWQVRWPGRGLFEIGKVGSAVAWAALVLPPRSSPPGAIDRDAGEDLCQRGLGTEPYRKTNQPEPPFAPAEPAGDANEDVGIRRKAGRWFHRRIKEHNRNMVKGLRTRAGILHDRFAKQIVQRLPAEITLVFRGHPSYAA